MKTPPKRLAWIIMAIAAVSLSFVVGRWSGALQENLKSEAEYPWELHRKIGSIDMPCEKLLNAPSIGRFYVQPLDNGATLIIASFDKPSGIVTAFALSASGRMATDTWPLECK